jgi:hypothetical protein
VKWTTKLAALQDYKARNGDTLVPKRYADEASDFKLGCWVSSLRERQNKLSDTQRSDLERLGFVWETSGVMQWEAKLAALQDYKERTGDALVPQRYVDESSGFHLGGWANNMRSGRSSLSDSQRNDLDRPGLCVDSKERPQVKTTVARHGICGSWRRHDDN